LRPIAHSGGELPNRKMIRWILAGCSLVFGLSACTPILLQPYVLQSRSSLSFPPKYYAPLQDAQFVSKAATIIVRYGPVLSDQDVRALDFTVKGTKSGLHKGRAILADDHKTVIFKPDQPFTPGEKVSVDINSLDLKDEATYPSLSYTFTVATNQQPGTPGSSQLANPPIPEKPPRSAFPNFLTVPQDIPHFTLTGTASGGEDADIFVAPFYWTESTVGSYLLILNGDGQLVYYRSAADALDAWDFKLQPNGMLSYYDQKDSTNYLMNSHYQTVAEYQAGNGYSADLHDFQILPNGHALLMIYDAETVDMSKIVLGGRPDATVTGLIIQEMDPSHNVIFEWRSWDHFSFADTTAGLLDQKIDLIHGNSVALTADGNLLLSSRNLSEITKIDLETGDIMWRFGGRANMFKFLNGQGFAYQHDVAVLPNGDITLFDNQGTPENPAPSRGVEYRLDETNMTATEVWNFAHTPGVLATFMGSAQRLPNGNVFLSWGAPFTRKGTPYVYTSMTEVTPDYRTQFEFAFDQPYVSYRAFIFPWRGFPDALPALVSKLDGAELTLGYSWNGATNVSGWRLYGGSDAQALNLLEQKPKTDFEVQSNFAMQPDGDCYFQVAALDKFGYEMARSRIISTDMARCPGPP
jgi:hypothetical protein